MGLNWDDCRYCHDGRMIPAGEERPAPHNSKITQVAYECDSCERHSCSPLWKVKGSEVATPTSNYGNCVPDDVEKSPHRHYGGDAKRKLKPDTVVDYRVNWLPVAGVVALMVLTTVCVLSGWW